MPVWNLVSFPCLIPFLFPFFGLPLPSITFPPWAPAGVHVFSSKNGTTFLVVALKTQVFTVTANAQNTLQHFQGRKCPRPCLRAPMSIPFPYFPLSPSLSPGSPPQIYLVSRRSAGQHMVSSEFPAENHTPVILQSKALLQKFFSQRHNSMKMAVTPCPTIPLPALSKTKPSENAKLTTRKKRSSLDRRAIQPQPVGGKNIIKWDCLKFKCECCHWQAFRHCF